MAAARSGVLSGGVARFGQDAEERIEELADELATGAYQPRDVTEHRIWLGKKERTLHIPPVRDRSSNGRSWST